MISVETRPDTLVAYLARDYIGNIYKVEIGRIKRIAASGEAAYVYYHSGATAAYTNIEDLYLIANIHQVVSTNLGWHADHEPKDQTP